MIAYDSAPVPLVTVLAQAPAPLVVGEQELVRAVAAGKRLVVLDDDPTGTQTIAALPVLTSWGVDDIRWALAQNTTAFFILVNTRSLSATDAAARDREVVRACLRAAALDEVELVFASRGDSTLRGHYPLETDVIAAELRDAGQTVDAVVIAPAYIEAGRITVDSLHWAATAGGMVPVGASDFARDATFGYAASDLADWVEEKTGGAIGRESVTRITLRDIRLGGVDRVAEMLSGVRGGLPIVVDAADDDDLHVLALALVRAESEGRTFLYRVGPSFVRARSGQTASPPIDTTALREPSGGSGHGLIVVGSHVPQTSRQLARLTGRQAIASIELESERLLGADVDAYVAEVAQGVIGLLRAGDVVLATSRVLLTRDTGEESLALSRAISSGVVGVVRAVTRAVRPAFVIAKGGITSSDVATDGLGIARAWVRGTLLPGIVSLWMPAGGPSDGLPYVVFAGNVGDDDALANVVDRLSEVP